MITQGKQCVVCGKGKMKRNMVSHSHRVALRKALPNLRLVRLSRNGTVRAVWVCAKCLKRGKVIPAPRRQAPASAKS